MRNEPISMTNIFIRCSSPGLFAEGVRKNKTSVPHWVIAIVFARSIFLSNHLCRLYNLINLELCLVRYEPISMTNIFIRCSSPGLFAKGVKKIRRVYCAGSTSIVLLNLLSFPLGIGMKILLLRRLQLKARPKERHTYYAGFLKLFKINKLLRFPLY